MKGRMLTAQTAEAVHTLGSIKERKEEIENKNQGCIKGITLVALVVTIVVLLILAGVTIIYVFGDNGIFGQASKAKEQTAIGKAREKLEEVLTEAKIYKHTEPTIYNDDYLDKMINEAPDCNVNGDIAISDGYAFNLDRSIPWIGEYVGKEKDLLFPTVTVSEPIIANDYKTATFTINAKEETKGINRIEIWLAGEKLDTIKCENEKIVEKNYTVNRNGTYTIKAYTDIAGSAKITINIIIPEIEFTPNGNKSYKKELTTKITVKNANEPVRNMKYKWTNSIKAPSVEEFTEECPSDNTITAKDITGKYYLWILIETESGKKNVCGSEEFYFDNVAPSGEITTEWLEEAGKNKLKIFINNIVEEHSGINYSAIKFYVTSESGTKQEKEITYLKEENSIIVDGINKESENAIELVISDLAENSNTITKKVGRIYFIKDGVNQASANKRVGTNARWSCRVHK